MISLSGGGPSKETKISQEEYNRLICNCFNAYGLPKPVFNAIAKTVVERVDKLMVGRTKFNKSLREFVKIECKLEGQKKNASETELNLQELQTRFDNLERTSQTLERDLAKNIKEMKEDIKKKALVTSLQGLEEKYVLMTKGMAANQLQAAMVFTIIDLCLETPSHWAKKVRVI